MAVLEFMSLLRCSGPSDKEMPLQLSSTAMESSSDTTGPVFDKIPQQKRTRVDVGSKDTPTPSWEGIQPDTLGEVLRSLPCLSDRASLRSVCHHRRTSGRGRGVSPPLPLLVFSKFRFSSLTPEGILMVRRRAWMPLELDADNACCVGSFDAWLVGAKRAGGECFLVNAFTHAVIHLPHLGSVSNYSLHKAALSASPESAPNYTVAAFGFRQCKPELALWKPGMRTWRVCHNAFLPGHVDIAFYQEKLYLLWRFMPSLFSVELGEDEHGVTFSSVKDCLVERLLPSPAGSNHELSCNMVEWHGRLLLIIRYYAGYQGRRRVVKVKAFAMDFSTNPYGLTEIHSFGTDCIFVGSGSSMSFPAGEHRGVEGDLIYFVNDHYNPDDGFAYSMRDGRPRNIIGPVPCMTRAAEHRLGFPVWLFPTE